MSSSSKTSLGLNMWVGSDKPKREDFCRDNEITDKTVAALQSTKADKTAVSEGLSQKAPLESPALTGAATLNGKGIATATPPQAHLVTLASGVKGRILFWQTQDGTITISLNVSKAAGFAYNEIVGTLPKEYWSRDLNYVSAIQENQQGTAACVMVVDNLGNIRTWTGVTGTGRILFQFSFIR